MCEHEWVSIDFGNTFICLKCGKKMVKKTKRIYDIDIEGMVYG